MQKGLKSRSLTSTAPFGRLLKYDQGQDMLLDADPINGC